MATEWLAIVGTVTGAAIALVGALLADVRRERSQRSRDRELDRWQTYAEFAEALDAAHGSLREVARSETAARDLDLYGRASHAVHDAGVYRIRERLLMSGTIELVKAGETAFQGLVGIRGVVRNGAGLATPEYHDAYHTFAEAIWTFRDKVRKELGEETLAPAALGRTSWSEREDCPLCSQAGS